MEEEDTGAGVRQGALGQAADWLARDGDKGQATCGGLSRGSGSNVCAGLTFLSFCISSPFPLLPPAETAELNANS